MCVGLQTRVQEAAAERSIESLPVPSTTLKKWATGHGHAGKLDMIRESMKYLGRPPEDDNEADAVYIKLSSKKPDGVVEVSEGVNLDTTSENEIVGIEILEASKRMDLKTILTYELDLDRELAPKRTPSREPVRRTSIRP